MTGRRALLAAALLGALAAGPAAQARTVRVFAVGPKFALDWVDTREHFHDHLLGLVDKRTRGADVQPQADDVASHLLAPPARRDLVAFPEDLGLMAIFTGSQGQQARGASDVTTAIVDVLGAYAPQVAYYSSKFPALTQRGIPTRLLAVAATDTFARVGVETFAEVAQRYHVWVEAGIDMAQSWHVVCEDKATMPQLPGGVGCDEVDAAKVAELRSPDEPARTYAYEATTDKASNMALVFDPQGRLVSKQIKTYLTPIELPGQLDLLPGAVFTGLSALRTPVGTLGFVTSKDAWMPDVTARLDEEHVDLLVQPEFFVGDTVAPTGPWAPDNIQGAGYSDVLRHPSIQAMALPELSGNLFDLSADNQQAIVLKPGEPGGDHRGALVGQPVAPGYANVGAWVAPDPDPARPPETIAQRRARLGAIGDMLLPKDGNPPCPTPASRGVCRGGQVEDVIREDVQVAVRRPLHRLARRKRAATPFSVDRPLAPAAQVQRNVALAARGPLVVAAFEQRAGAGDRVLIARSTDGGVRWSRPRSLGAGPHRWWPAVAVGPGGTVWAAWSDDHAHGQRVYVVRSADGGRTFAAPVAADAGVGPAVEQLRPAIAATGRNRALVAFVDDRARFTGDDLPQAGIWLVPLTGGRPGTATRMDSTAAPAASAATLDNAWAPSLAARGAHAELTWVDFRNYQWDVFARSSTDAGASWDAEQRVNDTPDGDEALEDTPRAALLGTSPLIAYTDWAKSGESARRASPLYDVDVARPGAPHVQVDGAGHAHVNAFSPAIATAGPVAVVAWQDHRHGPGRILAARLRAGHPGPVVPVADTGPGAANQWRPALAVAGRQLVAAWEDERDGPAQIFFARAPIRRVG